jgi:preprotein translocase subunit YajC
LSGSTLIIIYIAIFGGAFYLFAILPRRQQRRSQQELATKLAPGVDVVTSGGIYGTVTEIEDGDTVLIEVAEDTEVRVARASIARILTTTAHATDAASADADSTDADE